MPTNFPMWQELENVHDLKNEMSKMRQEISDLRKLVQSCMEWQAKLQGSIKDEISSAVRQSGEHGYFICHHKVQS